MTDQNTYRWGHSRRFNSYAEHFRQMFGARVQKISVDAGFTCPNRDGTIGTGGCTFCSNDAFNPSYCLPQKPIRQQVIEGIEFHRKRYRRAKQYLVYFQAYSNTYKPLAELKTLYREALECEGVIGLVIGTRPDLVDAELIAYLQTLREYTYVILEFGVESVYDSSLKRVNRGHDFAASKNAINLAAAAGIPCGAHLIFGLPGETRKQMLDSASIISALPLTTIKFHQLQLFKNTVMGTEYLKNPGEFSLFSLDEYIRFVVSYTEQLNPDIVIERFAGEVPPRFLVSPSWGPLRYDNLVRMIEQEMELQDTWQGKYHHC